MFRFIKIYPFIIPVIENLINISVYNPCMTCGIYSITNKTNNKIYIGSSKNCEYRFKQHQKELRGKYHKNDHLQKSINKYGLTNFDFDIISICDIKRLIKEEDKYINKLNTMNSKNGYNKKSADRTIMSKETIDKIKQSHNTPKYKKWLIKNAKENVWGNPKIKKRLLKNQWVSMHTPEHKQVKSIQRQQAWDLHPEIKKKYSANFKEKWDNNESPNRNKTFNKWRGSDEQKEIMSKRTKARWDNPKERKKMVNARKKFGSTKKFKAKISIISKNRWLNSNYKKKMSDKRKARWADPEFRKKMQSIKAKNLQVPIKCPVCKKEFIRNVHNQKICSKECKNKHRKSKKKKE